MKNTVLNRTLLTAIAAGSLAACEMVVEVDVPAHTPKLALEYRLRNIPVDTTQLGFDYRPEPFYLSLGHSQHILASQEELAGVTGARIVLRDAAGTVVDSFLEVSTQGGQYWYQRATSYRSGTNFLPQPGQEYRLQVKAPGYSDLDLVQRLPDLVPVVSSVFVPIPDQSDPYSQTGRLEIRFNDPSGQSNYYYLTAQPLDSLQQPVKGGYVNPEEEAFVGDNPSDVQLNSYFNDQGREGGQITISQKVRISDGYFVEPGQPGHPVNAKFVRIRLHHLSKDLFKFQKSLDAYYDADGNPFAEPVNVYSNIPNAYGIYGGSAISELIVPLP